METERGRKELLIIIPAFNEEQNLGQVLDGLLTPELKRVADVLVMDDASTDSTRAVALAHGAKCVTHLFNLGYGAGLKVGYKFAVLCGYRYVIQMDADGQHELSNIHRLWQELSEGPEEDRPDIVLGSRYMEGSGAYDCGLPRRVAYAWFRLLIRWITGVQVADPTTGLQGLSQRAFTYYSQYKHFDYRYPDANMVTQMLLLGFRLRQVPAVMRQRAEGRSMHSGLWKPILYMLRMTLQILSVWLRIRVLGMDLDEAAELLGADGKGGGG